MAVDDAWYVKQYPGVVEGIEDGAFDSAADHFFRRRYDDGRTPDRV